MTLPNLGSSNDRTAEVRAELEAAGLAVEPISFSGQEVPSNVRGVLRFGDLVVTCERAWTYYRVAVWGGQVPADVAQVVHELSPRGGYGGRDCPVIRALGDCNPPRPTGPVGSWQVDSLEGLRVLAEMLRSWPEYGHVYGFVVALRETPMTELLTLNGHESVSDTPIDYVHNRPPVPGEGDALP